MAKKKIEEVEQEDEYAEVPEEVLDSQDLKELEEIKNEQETKKAFDRDKSKPSESWTPRTKLRKVKW